MVDISIVTGTLNRLSLLQDMVASARAARHAGLSYEVVVVDGGSTDGTQAWCRTQGDIHLIEHGERRGAIRAFCDGARAATGEYVILANDDIVFEGHGLTRAWVHLETHHTCGAVAFADDRPAPGYPPGYKVQRMAARSEDGTLLDHVPYAQVGMFRRWLGDQCGWWGDADTLMAGAHTYGGDNYLSARIWEMGYTVDPVAGCQVRDLVHEDALRADNLARAGQVGSPYHTRYPHGPYIGWQPRPDNPQRERLRILYAPLYEPGYGQYKSGLREALARVGHVLEYDYLAAPGDWVRHVTDWQPHLLLMQVHNPGDLPAATLEAARRACPSMVVINWNGDVYADQLTSPAMLDLLAHVDLQLTVNADVLPVYAAAGVHAAYWQIGFEPVREAHLPKVNQHDVVFLANCYSDERRELGAALRALDGVDAGIYGRGWPDGWAAGECLYDFAKGRALYREAVVAIGDNQWGDRGFVSNRLFEALAAGALVLHQVVPGLEALTGLRDGVHYIAWHDIDDLRDKLTTWLHGDLRELVNEIAGDGRDFVCTHHSFDARVRQLFEDILPQVKEVRA